MATVLEGIITPALKDIGVLAMGETPTAGDANDAFSALNLLLDQWAAEPLLIYKLVRTQFTIVANTQDYSVGSTFTVNTPRPIFPLTLSYFDNSITPVVEIQLGPSLTDAQWAAVTMKSLTGTYPVSWYYNRTFPTGTISLYPIPTGSTLRGVLYAPAQVTQFATITESVSLPPGYNRMLVKNLALELCPSYEKEPSAALVQQAMDSKAAVKRSNIVPTELQFSADSQINRNGRWWDIRVGP